MAVLAAEGKRGWLFHPEKRSLEHILMMTIEPRGEMENLFANEYFTGEGKHSFRYSLIPHGGDWRAARVPQQAEQRIHACSSRHVYSRKGADLPLAKSFLSAEPNSIAASSWLYRDGGYEFRLYDATGRSGPVTIQLPMRAATCQAVNFNGQPLASPNVRLDGDRATFEIRPWEIVTLRFTPQS